MPVRLKIRLTCKILTTVAALLLAMFLFRGLQPTLDVHSKTENLSSDLLFHSHSETSKDFLLNDKPVTNSKYKSRQLHESKPTSPSTEHHPLPTSVPRAASVFLITKSHLPESSESPDQPNALIQDHSSDVKTTRLETSKIAASTPAAISHRQFSGSVRTSDITIPTDRDLHHLLHIVHLTESVLKIRHDCVPLPETPKHWAKICVLHSADNSFTELTKVDINLMLVDLGFRSGVYTVWAAAVGRPVLAIELNPVYITLMQRTIRANGLDSYITLVANSLSDVRQYALGSTQYPVIKRGNDKFLVHSICLDDLTPLVAGTTVYLRMDLRYSHPRVFACANVFFRGVFVKIIQMEWVGQSEVNKDLITQIMAGRGYTMSTRSTVQTLENMKDSKDMFFLRTTSLNPQIAFFNFKKKTIN